MSVAEIQNADRATEKNFDFNKIAVFMPYRSLFYWNLAVMCLADYVPTMHVMLEG
jgi:hypothetical protein